MRHRSNGLTTDTKVLLVALGVANAMGGMERFNRALTTELLELPHTDARVVSLWDEPSEQLRGCGRSKTRFARETVLTTARFRPHTIIIAHVLLLPLAVIGRLLRPHSRIVLIVHGVEAWSHPNAVQRACAAVVDVVCAVSEVTRGRFIESWRWQGPTSIIPNRLPEALISGPCAQHLREDATPAFSGGRTGSELRLLTVSRLEKRSRGKNIDTLLQALATCSDADLHLTVIGDGDDRERLERIAHELGVMKQVEFQGLVSDEELCSAYLASDVFVLPSTQEGFGIVFLEAWAHGLPAVGSDEGGSAEVLGHGQYGICVSPTATEIARSLLQLAADRDFRAELAVQGLVRLAHYSDGEFRRALKRMAT